MAVGLLSVLAPAGRALALDKQGSAHGGKVAGADSGFAASGSVVFGVAAYNPTYAARPDNTGKALLRLAPHADIDLIGSRLSIPIDINLFSDRERKGLGVLAPSEFDVISGLTSTWPVSDLAALEFGVRGESDRPVDRGGLVQSYGDARMRLLYALTPALGHLDKLLHGGGPAGSLTLGWFFWNGSYAARPDNSGLALLRYGANVSVDAIDHRLGLSLDATMFTDRRHNPLSPSELDFTPDVFFRVLPSLTMHVAYERDMPVDRRGKIQQFVLLSAAFDFNIWPPESAEGAAEGDAKGDAKGDGGA